MGSVSDSQANGDHQPPPAEMEDTGVKVEEADAGETMEGVASIALLPSGAISGHFIRLPDSVCYGLHGTPISCERECSRGEDYCLIKLSIIDFKNKREKVVVVECRGHDAARLQNIDHLHGWEDDIVALVEKKHGNRKFSISFECETLKADKAGEEHISKYMPNLSGLDAIACRFRCFGSLRSRGKEFGRLFEEASKYRENEYLWHQSGRGRRTK